MAELKPAYLISGEDAARIDAWRARLRVRVAAESPETTLEVLKDERLSAEAVGSALRALTLSTGRRFVLLDGVQRWSERDAKQAGEALRELSAETVAVFIAEGKAPKALAAAVEDCGGELHAYEAPRPSAYPAWVRERARELGLELDLQTAERLVERVGQSQQRLVRELEKLAIFAGGGRVSADDVEQLASNAIDARAWELADAVVEGDGARALTIAEDLRARGEDVMHILFALLRQLRNCRRTLALVSSGRSLKEVQSELRVPPFVARRLVAQARGADGDRLERAIDRLADLDYAIRGAGRLDTDSALTLTLARATGGRSAAA